VATRFRSRHGRIVGRLERDEVELLRGLLDDVVRLVRDDDPANPVTRRLFPDASPDPATAADLRDLLHDDLREAKLATARATIESLPEDGRVDVDLATAEQWLTALNDLRLTIGTAIGVTEETYEEERGGEDAGLHLYDWLTFLQDTLVEAVSACGAGR
jgi:hypothetical protein